MKHVVFSGGLFQNVALNNKILESRLFEEIFIPMAPSDAGLSLGRLYTWKMTPEKKKGHNFITILRPIF